MPICGSRRAAATSSSPPCGAARRPRRPASARATRCTRSATGPAAEAVAAFWSDLGLEADAGRAAFAARILAAGRRNALRRLTFRRGVALIALDLPSLYALPRAERPPVSVEREGRRLRIRFNNSLGDGATIAAFDAIMAAGAAGPADPDRPRRHAEWRQHGSSPAPSSAGSSIGRVPTRFSCPAGRAAANRGRAAMDRAGAAAPRASATAAR